MKIDSIMPDSALPDTPLIIKGDGLDTADRLVFGGEPVPFKVTSTGSIEANAPSGSGTVDVIAEVENGDKSNSVSFTFLEVH
ncbi:MAG: IPT/TIG domain-containing protein [Pseudonocardiaceae bacterium]